MQAKTRVFYLLSFIFFLQTILLSVAAAATKIMPLGDSITRGINGVIPPEELTGYRQKLYLDLIDEGYDIEFVGSEQEGESASPAFDIDHEGHGGWQASGGIGGGLANNVFDWLMAHPADIVLLHIGTNDITEGETPGEVLSQIELILDEIFTYDPDIIVIMAKIINREPYNADTNTLNNLLPGMVNSHANRENIFIVDQENALTYPNDLGDEVHPDETGYNKMADVWYSELEQILPDPDPDPDPDPSNNSSNSGCFIGAITD